MQRRHFVNLISGSCAVIASTPARADSSGPRLASYYERHMALLDGVAYGWVGRNPPMRMRAGANGVVIRGNEFTRIDQHPSPNASHADPIQIYGARNIVVDRNFFHDNEGTGGFEDFNGPNSGMVVTNNVFEANRRMPGDFVFPWAIAANSAQGWLIEHNTIVGGGSVRIDGSAASGNIVRNNLFVKGGLSLDAAAVASTTHHHNLNSGLSGAGNLIGNPTFVGGSAPTSYSGYALAPGSVGRNASSTGSNMGINP